MTKHLIKTENPEWGFFGTLILNYGITEADAATAFDFAARAIGSDGLRFLDSRMGRHFADLLSFHGAEENSSLSEIEKAISSAMASKAWSGKHGLFSAFQKTK